MSDCLKQLATLVDETLGLVKLEWEKGRRFTYAKSPVKPISIPAPKPAISPEKKQPPSFRRPTLRTGSSRLSKLEWALNPMPLPLSIDSLFESFCSSLPDLRLIKPDIPILLILPIDKPHDRLFLENVSRALTYTLAPARVLLAEETKLSNWCPEAKLIVAPLSFLRKNYPKLHLHCFYPTQGPTLLPIEEVESYLNDLKLKRILWNTLKTWHLPNTLRSSSA